MTKKEKIFLRRQIIENDKQNIFDLTKDFYKLDWYDITELDHYAEIFNIKSDTKSRARKLWDQITNIKMPF